MSGLKLRDLSVLVEEQAEDRALWWPIGVPGSQLAQLQLALRRLHGLIEGEPTPWLEGRP